jgi:hypothetical protein
MMILINLTLGAALLFLGRKLFWLFVGGVGFVVAATMASRFLHLQSEWLVIFIGLVAGLVGTIIAIFLQRLAIFLGGFLAGGYLLLALMSLVNVDTTGLTWLVFIIGGVVGALLMATLFDWSLILLSSLSGATLIVRALGMDFMLSALLFVAAVTAGIIVQAMLLHREKRG